MHTDSVHAPDKQPSPIEQRRADALKQCDQLIVHFKKKSREGKRAFQIFKYSSVILTVVVTVLSAIQGIEQWILPIFSGMAVLATTMLSVTSAQDLWLNSRTTQQQLTVEKFLFLQEAGEYAKLGEQEKIQRFSERVMRIWSAGHEQWQTASQEIE